MKIIYGNLWDVIGHVDYLLVTTNATLTRLGALVMGRGAALQAAQLFPGLAERLGSQIKLRNAAMVPRDTMSPVERYGIVLDRDPVVGLTAAYPTRLGAFQVKYHFREPAELSLIEYSSLCLARFAQETLFVTSSERRLPQIALNYPGIGWGKRSEEEIRPILENLPDNVTFYRRLGER